jgi:uncharacterized membrane protein
MPGERPDVDAVQQHGEDGDAHVRASAAALEVQPPAAKRPPLSTQISGGWRKVVPGFVQRRRWAPATLILVLAGLVLVGAWVQKSPCLHTTPSWANGLPYRYACYSDVIPLYGTEGFEDASVFPYDHYWTEGQPGLHQRHHYMEYPVLTGLLMWTGAELTHGYLSAANAFIYLPKTMPDVVFFNILALLASAFWLFTVWCITRMTRRRVWDGAIAALSPIVIVQAFTNFDMLAVALATGGLLAWSRKRPVLAGVLIGLGTAAKLYPVLLLIPLFALCLRAGKIRQWGSATLAALISWELVNAPIELLFPTGWYEFIHLNSTRGADPDSLYNVLTQFTGWGGFDGPLPVGQAPTKLNAFIAVLLIACLVAIVVIALSAPRRPRFAQLAFLAVSAFLLTNKVWSPQYSLWLIPLAVLAMPRWKPLLAWMLIDTWLWVSRMYFYLNTNEGGWGQNPFLITVSIRDFAVAALCARVIYEIYRPERDLVRSSGDDDPVGGVLENAPDSFVLGRRRRRAVAGAPA